MNDDLQNLDIKQLPFITSDKEQTTKAIRELPGKLTLDVREIAAIGPVVRVRETKTPQFNVYTKSGAVLIVEADIQYKEKLIQFWRYHNGI